jgi:hypothetical protein
MKMKRNSIWVVLRILFYLLMGLMMNTLVPSSAATGDHIKITREIFLEGRTDPTGLVQTKDGGYVVFGGDFGAWATRIDRDGKIQWKHVVLPTSQRASGAKYTGAAMLPDDSTILCGYKELENGAGSVFVGLLTHIDKAGQVITEQLIYPKNDKRYTFSQFNKSVALNDGVVVFGSASGLSEDQPLGWTLVIDGQGKIKSEKLVPKPAPIEANGVLALSSHDLVVSTFVVPPPNVSSPEVLSTQITHIDASGIIKEQRVVRGESIFVSPVVPDTTVRFMLTDKTAAAMTIWGSQLQDGDRIVGNVETIKSARSYLLPDRSVVLFGYDYIGQGVFGAMIVWLSPDLNQRERLVLEPKYGTVRVEDAIPTGKPGEFATIRSVLPVSHLIGPDDTRVGVVLAFVQFR